jgi:hypothetical protein
MFLPCVPKNIKETAVIDGPLIILRLFGNQGVPQLEAEGKF